jgi:hypothetical protein
MTNECRPSSFVIREFVILPAGACGLTKHPLFPSYFTGILFGTDSFLATRIADTFAQRAFVPRVCVQGCNHDAWMDHRFGRRLHGKHAASSRRRRRSLSPAGPGRTTPTDPQPGLQRSKPEARGRRRGACPASTGPAASRSEKRRRAVRRPQVAEPAAPVAARRQRRRRHGRRSHAVRSGPSAFETIVFAADGQPPAATAHDAIAGDAAGSPTASSHDTGADQPGYGAPTSAAHRSSAAANFADCTQLAGSQHSPQ